MPGLLQSYLYRKFNEQHQNEEAERKQMRDLFLKAAVDPNSTEFQQQSAWEGVKKHSNPKTKQLIDEMSPMAQKLVQMRQKQIVDAQSSQALPSPDNQQLENGKGSQEPQPPFTITDQAKAFNAGPKTDSAPASPVQGKDQPAAAIAQSPIQQFNQGPSAAPPPQASPLNAFPNVDERIARGRAVEEQDYNRWLQRGKEVLGPNASPRDLAEFAGTKGQKLPTQLRPIAGTRKPLQFTLPDKSTLDLQQDSRTGLYYDPHNPQGDPVNLPDGAVPVVTARTGFVRSVPHSVGLADALQQEANGVEYNDADGKKIDLSKLPKDMGLQAMVRGDKMFWVPVTPSQKTVVVGNQVYGVNPYQVQSIGTPDVPALGPSRTGSSSTPTQVVMDNAGVPHVLGATTTPNTPGARPQGAPATPARAPVQGPPQGQGRLPAPISAPPGPGQLRGVPLPAYTRQMQDVRPVRVGVAQLFGDPGNPNFKGLKDYAPLADDKAAQQRLGTAFNLVMKGIDANPDGRVHVGAGGVGVDAGGLVNLLENWAGVPSSLAKSEQELYAKTYAEMSPLEREALNATFESLSTAVGARKLTGASPAMFATQALERDVPIIGRSVFSSNDFYDKLSRFAEMIKNGAAGTFPQVWQPGELQRINQLPSEMQALKKQGVNKAPSTPNNYKVGDSVNYQGKPHKIKDIKNGKLVLEP